MATLTHFTEQASAAISSIASSFMQEKNSRVENGLLITSPYTDMDHRLDLSTLSTQDQLLARALTDFKCLRPDYATAPYEDTFNFSEVVAKLRDLSTEVGHSWTEQAFYIVVFRSQIPQTTDYSHLGELDKAAHYEAMKSGGFLKYWFGTPDVDGRNLATCIWRKPEDAKRGSVGTAHRRAAGATRLMYSEWHIERLRFTIHDGAETWTISDWTAQN